MSEDDPQPRINEHQNLTWWVINKQEGVKWEKEKWEVSVIKM